jgi:hypothetical protein
MFAEVKQSSLQKSVCKCTPVSDLRHIKSSIITKTVFDTASQDMYDHKVLSSIGLEPF